MSDYRDDSNDTAVIGSETWLALKGFVAEEFAKISSLAIITIGTLLSDSALAGDETFDATRRSSFLFEAAQISDETWGQQNAHQQLSDSAKIAESLTHATQVDHIDSAKAGDELVTGSQDWVMDTLQVSEVWSGTLRATVQLQDSIKVSDAPVYHGFTLLEDGAQLGDQGTDHLHARQQVIDSAQLWDDALGGFSGAGFSLDSATVQDASWGQLRARQQVIDSAQIEDEVGQGTGSGQIWTANSVFGWAMSRYRIDALGMASIDGVGYLTTADGVYALDGESDTVEAQLVTGRVDVGKSTLAIPAALYLEYELDGAIEVEVTQYQTGVSPESYSYQLPSEVANTLTNGRVMFGKGLRGRHFSFAVTITGQRAYINDMSLLVAPIKRRV